nr:hypothetical protein [Tanacetum cinerariifolium]
VEDGETAHGIVGAESNKVRVQFPEM